MSAIALTLPHDAADHDREGVRRAFAEQLSRLPEQQARAFRMRDIECLPPARICEMLGISDQALGDLLYEARVAMCHALARRKPT